MRTDAGMPPGIVRDDVEGVVFCTICSTRMHSSNASPHSKRHVATERRADAWRTVQNALETAELVGPVGDWSFTRGSENRIISAEVNRREVFKETEEDMQ